MVDRGGISTSRLSCAAKVDTAHSLSMYSIVDMDLFKHDPAVEEFLEHVFPNDVHEYDPDALTAYVASSSSKEVDPRVAPDLSSVTVPTLDQVIPDSAVRDVLPDTIRSLYQLDTTLQVLQLSATAFYKQMRATAVELSSSLPPRGHIDGGSLANTTDRSDYLWHYRVFGVLEATQIPLLRVADDTAHRPTGIGFVKIPTMTDSKYVFVECYHTPQIPATIISPDVLSKTFGCSGHITVADFVRDVSSLHLTNCALGQNRDVVIALRRIRGLLYTESFIAPTASQRTNPITTCPEDSLCPAPSLPVRSIESSIPIRVLSREQQRMLWHMRLGHINDRRISTMHQFADGVPQLPQGDSLHKCPLCSQAKLHKAARVAHEPDATSECWQHVQIDFGFMVQKSKNEKRFRRMLGINQESCYVLLVCRHSGAWRISIRRDKKPPLDFLRRWLSRYGSTAPIRTVRFDEGGELGSCTEVHELFEKAGYEVQVTSPDTSNEIGAVERPHRIIADAVRTLLHGARLELHFWPYALLYFVLIANCVPRGDRDLPPVTICTGRRPDLRLLRIFGCRVYALPPGKRKTKLDINAKQGIFLGYHKTFHHVYYFDLDTKKIKTCRHVAFDEGMLASDDPPPFARLLRDMPPAEDDDNDLEAMEAKAPIVEVSLSPFTSQVELVFPFDPGSTHPLGFSVGKCSRQLRAFATTINIAPARYSLRSAATRFTGGYILAVQDINVFSPEDVEEVVAQFRSLPTPPTTVTVLIAHDLLSDLRDDRAPPLHLRAVDLRRSAALTLVAGEGMTSSDFNRAVTVLVTSPSVGYTPADPADLLSLTSEELLEVRRLQVSHMTDEEKQLTSFTRRNVMKLKNWKDWRDADDLQLDQHFASGTIGKAILRSQMPHEPGSPSQVFRVQWARIVRATGKRKSRACLDGSKRAAPWLRQMVQTYASCIELPCMRMFFALAALRGHYIMFGDVVNAYQQSPPPTVACFLKIDESIQDWYYRRFNERLDMTQHVLPVLKALQGHPEAGVLWERLITDILVNRMGFRSTVQERNLYVGVVDDNEVLVCRQVDDMACSSTSRRSAAVFFRALQSHVESELHEMGLETPDSYFERYNGLDVHQTRDFIKIDCITYVDRVLQTHGWSAPENGTSDPANLVPIRPDKTDELMRLEGPIEKTPEAIALANKAGFAYRTLLGELIYAYVLCRIDIGYAVCFLSRFSQAPHAEHYRALKHVCRYLRKTKTWGILYWRPRPLIDLPTMVVESIPRDADLPSFPSFPMDELVAFLDAAHATDIKSRRSVTGLIIVLCGAAITWKSRLQATVATSSTEAEFLAAVLTAKLVKYLRSVLLELGFLRDCPSTLYVDNQATVDIVNERRPTPRSRHIEVQHFAIQEWHANKDIVMRHLAGILNPSDDLTKALGWVLHARHARRGMGHYGPSSDYRVHDG